MIIPDQIAHSNFRTPTVPPKNAPAIEVLSIEPGQVPGLLAILSARIGGIVINRIRVTNYGRGVHVNFPSRKVEGGWDELVEIRSPALRKAVVEVILAAVRSMGGAA